MRTETDPRAAATASCPVAAGLPDGILGALPGFRHFLGDPPAAERFQVDGADPRQSAPAMATLRRRLRGLALLMGDRPAQAAENPRVPAGYTYLLQLTAHDLVSTTTGFWSAGGPHPGVANAAGAPLRLRTLYGDGPGACPFAFAPDGARDPTRSRFRLSAVGGEAAGGEPRPRPSATSAGRRRRARSAAGAATARRCWPMPATTSPPCCPRSPACSRCCTMPSSA